MITASLELCRELYELSGWTTGITGFNYDFDSLVFGYPENGLPAYDLGYLLRKLDGFDVRLFYSNQWRLWYCANDSGDKAEVQNANTPEDAACKLAIELFKQGILKK